MQMKTLVMVIMMLMMMSLIVLTTGQRWVARPTTCLSLIESLSGPVKDEPGTFKVEIENEPKYYVPYERYVG